MRALGVAALVLVLAAPAHAAPFGKPRTIGTTPSEYEYDFMFSSDGPRGGVAFFVGGERIVGTRPVQRLYVARVEGSGRTHPLTTTRLKGRAPIRSYDGGPPRPYLAVGPGWRMLTTEVRGGDVVNGPDVFGVRIAPNGRRLAEQRVGPQSRVGGFMETNARGDAILRVGEGFAISRAAAPFARAPAALRHSFGLPRLAADGSLHDLRRRNDGSLGVAHSTGRRWSAEQTVVEAAPGRSVGYADVATSAAGDALLAYAVGDPSSERRALFVRWSRRGGPFGPPVELATEVDRSSVAVEALPRGRFAVRWRTGARELHLARATGPRRPFREVASWTVPESFDFRTLLHLADGRTVAAWATEDPARVEPDRLKAFVIDARGRRGPEQTLAVGSARSHLDGFQLRRVGAKRAALLWTQSGAGKKRVRVALTPR